jgi:hypothetical protein
MGDLGCGKPYLLGGTDTSRRGTVEKPSKLKPEGVPYIYIQNKKPIVPLFLKSFPHADRTFSTVLTTAPKTKPAF